MRRVPHGPNCKLCAAPFEGPGGAVLKHLGFARFPGNPAICGSCIKDLNKLGVFGAEIPVSLLFADIRGSTAIGERSSPTEFRTFLDRFYRLSSRAILDNDGIVDKFVGDEVIGLFFSRDQRDQALGGRDPGRSGPARRRRARRCDREWADPRRCGRTYGRSVCGLDSGRRETVSDFTALGDVVNTAARLASEAVAGELLVSIDAARAAGTGLAVNGAPDVNVRGRIDTVEVVALRSSSTTS